MIVLLQLCATLNKRKGDEDVCIKGSRVIEILIGASGRKPAFEAVGCDLLIQK